MTELINQGAYGCLFYPGVYCNGNIMKNGKYATKLVVKDESAMNEVKMGQLIKKILNYAVNFVPVVETCSAKFGKVMKKNLQDQLDTCNIYDEQNEYMMMKMPYIDSLYFYEYITRTMKKNKKIFTFMFESYAYLIESIQKLVENGIVHYDIKLQNILVNLKTETPVIIDFGLSFLIEQNPTESFWIKTFYKFSPEYYSWPIEAHIINYVQNVSNSGVLTLPEIKMICEKYVYGNNALHFFSTEFQKQFLKACIQQYQHYAGQPREVVRSELLVGAKTWDSYSLSISFIQLIAFASNGVFRAHHFVGRFLELLLTNIHPDPKRRNSIEETKNIFTDMFYEREHIEIFENVDFDIESFSTSYSMELTQSHPSVQEK